MSLISKLRQSQFIKKALYLGTIIFCFLYVFCVPTFGENTGILRFTIYFSLIVLGIVSVSFCFLYDNLKLNRICLLVPLFVLFAFLGTLFYSKQFKSYVSLVLLMGSFFVFVYSFKAIKNKYLVLMIISLALFTFSAYFLFYFRNEILSFRTYGNEAFRLGPPFDNQNGVAAYAIIGVATSLYLVLFLKKRWSFVFVVPTFASLLVGIVTGSRSFILAFAVFVVVFLYFKFQKHKFIYLIVLAASIGLGILLLNLPFMSTIKDRIVRSLGTIFGFGTRVDTSTVERVIWTDYGFFLGSKNVFIGCGVNGFSIFSGVDTYAHSNYAETICDFGAIGFLIFYAPLVIFLVKCFIDRKIDKSLVIPFVAYYLIISISNVIYYKKVYFLILAFLFYLVYVEGKSYKKKPLIPQLNSVVFTCDTMGSGGAERVIALLANQMAAQNIKVTIIGVGDVNEPRSFYSLDNDVVYTNLSNNNGLKVNFFKRIYRLRKKLNQINPDVIISFLPNANIYTFISNFGTRIPHVVSERNNPYIDPKEKLIRILKKLSFFCADGCVFQTNDARAFYKHISETKVTIIKNPIYLTCVPNRSKNIKKIVLAVGRLTEQKNYISLLDAFKEFNAGNGDSYILKIYGDGPLKGKLVSYTKQLGIDKHVVFAGNDSLWHRKENDDSMYVLSSNYEGMPNALAEAMALGIPSISTDCPTGGSRELIQDGYNGFLVPVNNYHELANRMNEIVNNSKLNFSGHAEDLRKQFSVEKITNDWIIFIKNLEREVYE